MHSTATYNILPCPMSIQISERYTAPVVLKNHERMDMENVENEDKNIIYNILQTISHNKEVIFSYKIFPKCIFLTLSKCQTVSYDMLEKINIVSERIQNITINFRKKNMVVMIRKKTDLKIKIRKRDVCDKRMAEVSASNFVETNNIRNEDKRVFTAIVKHFFAWTWKSIACHIDLEQVGDRYKVQVTSIMTIDYKKLRTLDQMGPWIHNMQVDLESAVLSFEVSRTETINGTQQSNKKIKYN